MPWVRTDDRFHEDPDLDYLSPEAVCLDKCAISWCSLNLTDGFIPSMRVTKLHGFSSEAIVLLTTACAPGNKPWWIEVDGGYQIRSYLKYNPSREQVLSDRASGKERAASSYRRKKDSSVVSSPEDLPEEVPENSDSSAQSSGELGRARSRFPNSQLDNSLEGGSLISNNYNNAHEGSPWW
ncbi:MAG: hypothetical protein ABL962_21975, partial [Fimbriimonadaceae bacterium]